MLVDHHLTLSNIAQQRNLDDPATVAELASIVKHQKLERSDAAYSGGRTGHKRRGMVRLKEWLVWQLFHETSRYLTDRKAYYEQTKIERETLQLSVAENLSADYADEIEAHP